MSAIKVNCTGETCPVPLVETRKALGLELMDLQEKDGVWKIKIRR